MRKILSYFYPITQKIETVQNGIVEITYYNGKKMLNSAHANYSYDSLQRILKYGLTKVNLKQVNAILLLGLGGGSVIQTLRNDFNYTKNITAIEIDSAIISIAATEFHVFPSDKMEIIHADAFQYVNSTSRKFDLIIVDLFIDDTVPDAFYSRQFWFSIVSLMNINGAFIFNAALATKVSKEFLEMLQNFSTELTISFFDNVYETNSIIVGQKRS